MRDGFTGDRARDAILTIDRFVIGWCLDEASVMGRGAANPRPSRDTEFEFGLEILVAGLAAVGQQVPQSALRTRRRSVTMGIWALLRYARQSGESAYASSQDLTELERRLLAELRRGIVSRSAEMIASSGLDKAQVSRAVRRLDEAGLLFRDGARGPLGLTIEGERVADGFITIGDARNDEIIADIGDDDLADFAALIAQMTASAIKLLEQEQSWEAPRGQAPQEPLVAGVAVVRSRDDKILVLPPLATLYSYMQRSGALMIRRVADMSNFAWLVLSTVAEMGPMTPAALIEMVERDHSQARRTLRHLIELGLVTQFAIPGQRGRMLHPTEKGRGVARRLENEGWSRDTMLYGEIPPERLERFLTVLDKLTRNAMAQVERCTPDADR
jgi:DNA-binding MarR family transcriptional regulator